MTTVIEHRYGPRGGCAQLFSRRDDEVLLSGPAGTGKSRACLEKLHALALKYPGMRGLIVRKTATSLTNTALVTWREKVVPEALTHGVLKWYGGSAQEAAGYHYGNGSVINVGGMDKSERIMSSEYDVVYAQEATELTVTDWEAITSRLRNGRLPYQQIIADCNPNVPHHWLKKRCDQGIATMLYTRHEDNPVLFTADGEVTSQGAAYIAKLDNLTGVRKQRLRYGRWVAAEGLIYEDWREDIHLVDPFDIPWDWPRYWSVDFGYTNPFVLQCWAEDGDGRLVMYRELYQTRRLVEDHCATIARIVMRDPTPPDLTRGTPWRGEWLEPLPRAVICDHDAEGRGTLERHLGIGTTAAVKTVTDGIQEVQSRLQDVPGQPPRLTLVRGCTVNLDPELLDAGRPASTQEEFPGYIWDIREGKPPKETPVKVDDHGMDAVRYICMHRRSMKRVGTFHLPGATTAEARARARAEARRARTEV